MKPRWILAAAGVGLVGAGSLGLVRWRTAGPPVEPKYRWARVEVGDIVQTVRATGTLQPINVVDVGAQVNGPIQALHADYNDRVQAGQVVAQIDPTVYEARVAQDEANLIQSRAALEQARSRLEQAERDLERARLLAEKQMLSQAELDAAQANRAVLAAQVHVAEAAIAQAEAALRLSRANWSYTTIRSPVDGVVLARQVSEGQTVVANLSAQVLFRIATDLTEMQLEAAMPEADIGKVRVGQPVRFTVDAYDRTFTGSVWQVRLAAATVQNVVTYPVIIRALNPDGLLFPGMTANVVVEVDRRPQVLRIPNASLRLSPPESDRKAEREEERERPAAGGRRVGRVWVRSADGARLEPVRVELGISDGSFTEILAGQLSPGVEVAVGALAGPASDSGLVNPFAPPRPPGLRR